MVKWPTRNSPFEVLTSKTHGTRQLCVLLDVFMSATYTDTETHMHMPKHTLRHVYTDTDDTDTHTHTHTHLMLPVSNTKRILCLSWQTEQLIRVTWQPLWCKSHDSVVHRFTWNTAWISTHTRGYSVYTGSHLTNRFALQNSTLLCLFFSGCTFDYLSKSIFKQLFYINITSV